MFTTSLRINLDIADWASARSLERACLDSFGDAAHAPLGYDGWCQIVEPIVLMLKENAMGTSLLGRFHARSPVTRCLRNKLGSNCHNGTRGKILRLSARQRALPQTDSNDLPCLADLMEALSIDLSDPSEALNIALVDPSEALKVDLRDQEWQILIFFMENV